MSIKQPRDVKNPILDRKAAFDAGYQSFESGSQECNLNSGFEGPSVDKSLTAMWHAGWKRAREDSSIPSHYPHQWPVSDLRRRDQATV